MRYCRLMTDEGPQWGAVEERDGEWWVTKIVSSPEEDRVQPYKVEFVAVKAGEARLLAPVKPSKIVCVGRNYAEHAKELGNEAPKEPLLFLKPPSAVIGPGETIRRPAASQRVDFEGELGVVIGKRARDVGEDEDVRPYIRGYVCVNDVTARDLQKTDGQWTRAKGFDTFCPVGPWVLEQSAVDPAAGLGLTTKLNGELKQQGTTDEMVFDVATLVRYISRIMTLMPGDLIATGTPAGVGPMEAGDVVEVEIQGLGVLRNPVV
jgi:2-keto-4-pentenoate hydratase/2-oxohepta-3-ene-1,7-dioic acid hydratase in catechol pathway